MKIVPQVAGQRNLIIVAVMATLTLGAMLLVWRASDQRQREQISQLSQRLASAQSEARSVKVRLGFRSPDERIAVSRGVLAEMELSFINLRAAVLTGGDGSFSGSLFDNGDLSDAVLKGGDASFQGAHFNDATLINATLDGGVSAFQLASFENADLSGATLTGAGAAFSSMSLAGAKLIGTRFHCSGGAAFQAVNIDAAQFSDADLSSIDRKSLEASYFQTAPTYDDQTQFPNGFDPVAQGWTKVAE